MKITSLRPVMIMTLPVLLSLGCGLSSLISGNTADTLPTRTPMPTFTPTVDGAAFVQAQVPETPPTQPPPADTPTVPPPTAAPAPPVSPVDTPTPENSGPPQVTIVQNMNVRTGPGTNYPVAGPGPAGESANIIGRNNDSSWLQVEYPLGADGTGWVYADLVKITGDVANVSVVQVAPPPVAAAPPPAEPTPESQEPAPTPVPEVKYQFTPSGWHASENAGIAQFKGRIRDEGGGLVNGFSILASNGSFSVLSRPAGSNPWFPDVGPGEWDVVLPNIHTAQGWWWLTVVRYDCDFWSGFDALCKSFTRLSEDVKVQIASPAESIINADWVCHWDCNKGLYVQCNNQDGKVTCN